MGRADPALHWRFEAAHLGPLSGSTPTSKIVVQHGIGINQSSDGKLTRAWLQVDRLGVLQQFGSVTH
jgi:hypothetical protein